MNLWRTALTGADDGVSLDSLVNLSKEHPLIEWGILYSSKRAGQSRYPTRSWIATLGEIAQRHRIACSMHLCGTAVDEFIEQKLELLALTAGFDRIQLNFNQTKKPKSLTDLVRTANQLRRPLITQHHPSNADLVGVIRCRAHHVLFDASGGRGQSPAGWSAPLPGHVCGYAGGLGPDNLAAELPRIVSAARGQSFWIDMESSLRGPDDQFSLSAVKEVMRIVETEQRQRAQADD